MNAPVHVQLPRWAHKLRTPSRYKALYGGRGAGKSRSVATELVIRAANQPERILCAREVQRSIKDSVKRLLDDEIDRMNLRSLYTSTESEIRCANGSLFLFAGLRGNAAGIKSLEGVTIAWTEEASAVSQASLETLVPTIRAPNSELWFTWNPDLETDPIDAMFRGEHPPPDTIACKVNYDDNPWFPDVLRKEMEWDRERDPEKYAHIWRGEYRRNSEARVFKNWKVEEFDTPDGVTHRLGADFGFSIDPSCALRCHIQGRTLYVDHEAYRIGCEIDNLPDLFMSIPEAEKWPMVADTSRPETISYLRRHGFPKVLAAIKGARSVEEGIAFLQSYDIVVHPRCQHVIDELTLYSYKLDPLTGLVLPILEDKNNHMIDSLRYACEGVRRVVAVMPAPISVAVPRTATAFNRR